MKYALPFLFLAAIGCDEVPVRQTDTQLASLLAEDTLLSFRTLRFSGQVTLFANKSAHLDVVGLGQDNGKWWQQGDKVCSRWAQALRKQVRCIYVSRYSDGTYSALDPTTGFSLGRFQLTPVP